MTSINPSPIYCPGCKMGMIVDVPGPNRCPTCGWVGDVYTFQPAEIRGESAELALPDDATCIHHPRKKATAVCAGTGDYICSLCSVDVSGQTYSAQYLDAGGKAKAAKAFDRALKRPDSHARSYLLFPFIPYVNFLVIPFAFIWLPHGFILVGRARRLRREDPVYARLVSPLRLGVITAFLIIYSVSWIVGIVALTVFLTNKSYRF
jgi:hypothetical protein